MKRSTMGLSVFYLAIIAGLILCQPIANPTSATEHLKSLQTSNITAEPVQGLASGSCTRVLFATGKSDDTKTSGGLKEENRATKDNSKQLEDHGGEDNGDDELEGNDPSDGIAGKN
jgi:hypothetical protein